MSRFPVTLPRREFFVGKRLKSSLCALFSNYPFFFAPNQLSFIAFAHLNRIVRRIADGLLPAGTDRRLALTIKSLSFSLIPFFLPLISIIHILTPVSSMRSIRLPLINTPHTCVTQISSIETSSPGRLVLRSFRCTNEPLLPKLCFRLCVYVLQTESESEMRILLGLPTEFQPLVE